jgi:hypothetical protein
VILIRAALPKVVDHGLWTKDHEQKGDLIMSRNKFLFVLLLAGTMVYVSGCAGYNTQVGAVTGAGAGALIGYGIGHDTQSALIGTALGGTAGAVIGHGIDTYNSRNGYPYNYGYSNYPYNYGYSNYPYGYKGPATRSYIVPAPNPTIRR